MDQNDMSNRVVIVGSNPADTAMLRQALSNRHDVIVADRMPDLRPTTATRRWEAEDEAAHRRRQQERERTEWNAAVDAKKANRLERRIARRWSRA